MWEGSALEKKVRVARETSGGSRAQTGPKDGVSEIGRD